MVASAEAMHVTAQLSVVSLPMLADTVDRCSDGLSLEPAPLLEPLHRERLKAVQLSDVACLVPRLVLRYSVISHSYVRR